MGYMLKIASRLAAVATAVLLLVACGEDGKPRPGFADPCSTPMAGTLGCPVAPSAATTVNPTIHDACHKLVACGILAGEFLHDSGRDCAESKDCPYGGECMVNGNGDRHCHNNYLDYHWCTGHLSNPGTHPCSNSLRFTSQQVDTAVQCIWSTPCASLGLLFWQKRISSSDRPELDKFTCSDGQETTWTATTCDHGLLEY